jgi:hypothetical protein
MIVLMISPVSALAVNGCAFGTRQAALEYPPKKLSETYAREQGSSSSSTNAPRIVLVPFTDERADKVNIGEVRNGWGMHTADVVSKNDVVQWINDAIKLELERAGYAVSVGQGGSPSKDDAVLSGQILTVFCKALFSYEGEVSLFVTLERNGKEMKRRYTGEGSAGMNLALTQA